MYDVIIVGGGPAGLSAALILGRARRRVLLCDDGRPRNYASRAVHGYLGLDGIHPHELHRRGRGEAARYGVDFVGERVVSARPIDGGGNVRPRPAFQVTLAGGRALACRKLLLATGVRDVLPPVDGVAAFYGVSVHHCPFCDGWEHRDEHLVAYGSGEAAVGLALMLRTWSEQVTACTDGVPVSGTDRDRCTPNGICWRDEKIMRLEGAEGRLRRIHFAAGPPLECDALFFNTDQVQRSDLPAMLGCDYTPKGMIHTEGKQRTGVPSLFLAGDADGDVQFAVVAAAEGARAAVAINRELQDEDRGQGAG